MSSPTTQKKRSFCFTINNYTDEDINQCKNLPYKYIILGKEKGEEGTPHIQGYVFFSNPISFKSFKKKLPRAHIEVCRGSPQQNVEYCSKEEILFSEGEIPKSGKRNDLDEIRKAVQNGEDMRTIITSYPANYQTIKYAETIRKYLEKPRNWKPNVKWYYGETGTGKTKTAYEVLGENAYFKDGTKWWDGYDAHESIIIDDFRPSAIPFQELLRILDRYPHTIENKGGTRQLLAKTIIITAPYHPNEMFSTSENIQQLLRRIDEIREFK